MVSFLRQAAVMFTQVAMVFVSLKIVIFGAEAVFGYTAEISDGYWSGVLAGATIMVVIRGTRQ